ncbi:NAD-dependent malic enzyme [archaeon]|jgi:malate dehydrogenase (oxaloacetate-decarboxylating)|nr:NAD-dependent malic enzyme [archaeon]MBT6869768.1 NAD-dependent malic enzyme [archaeon]MBT7192723.1 NAD-dependent malic enzyme [archaeon]MBT7380748.1 NAD-dependent malic enzyme [archaeon]MBT7508316.1 NAD-dependent malic enzyme [archaeon]
MDNKNKFALDFHKKYKGKIEVISKVPLNNKNDLSVAYTPGVAYPCLEINQDASKIYDYTSKGNMVAVVTDGSAVLGLGDIGAGAGLPVMEGKAVLFKQFGGVDAFPICIDSKNPDIIVETVRLISPGFGGINLEDISAPRCFEIEDRLKKLLDIPVFHDDQHGTAIVVLAGLINASKIIGKDICDLKVIFSGAGAAGIACANLLLKVGIKNIIMCDSKGAIFENRENLNSVKLEMSKITNKENKKGTLSDVIVGANVFIGVSAPGVLTKEMVSSMSKNAIIFAMANPVPEIMPNDALSAGAAVVATGRSDFPNQINNVLAFPGVFRGALDVRASKITDNMKIAAAKALAKLVENPTKDKIIPSPFDKNVANVIADAVKKKAIEEGLNRI